MIFDTSVLVTLELGSQGLEKLAAGRESEPFGISVPAISELLHGVHRADSVTAAHSVRSTFLAAILLESLSDLKKTSAVSSYQRFSRLTIMSIDWYNNVKWQEVSVWSRNKAS